MTHAQTPDTAASWWRRVLAFEPVAVQAAVRALVLLVGAVLAGFGLDLPDGIEPWLIGVVAAFYVAVEAVTTMLARRKATPDAKVVQTVEPDGRIVAGPASPAPTGATLGYVAEDAVHIEMTDVADLRHVQVFDGDRPVGQVTYRAESHPDAPA